MFFLLCGVENMKKHLFLSVGLFFSFHMIFSGICMSKAQSEQVSLSSTRFSEKKRNILSQGWISMSDDSSDSSSDVFSIQEQKDDSSSQDNKIIFFYDEFGRRKKRNISFFDKSKKHLRKNKLQAPFIHYEKESNVFDKRDTVSCFLNTDEFIQERRCVSCPPGFMKFPALKALEQKQLLLEAISHLSYFKYNTNLKYGIERMSIKEYSGKDFFELHGVVGGWLAGKRENHVVSCSRPLPLVVYTTLGITQINIRSRK